MRHEPKKGAKNRVNKPGGDSRRGDARTVALGALYDVTKKDAYASLALNAALSSGALSPLDKRLATNIFYTTLENLMRIDYTLKQFVDKAPEGIVNDILRMAVAQILYMDRLPDYAVVNEASRQARAFGFEGYVPLINGALRNVIRAKEAGTLSFPKREDGEIEYLSTRYSLPRHLTEKLISQYGVNEAESILAYRPDTRVETVRPNLLRMDPAAFEKYLEGRKLAFSRTAVTGVYAITGAGDLARDPGFKEGLFSIQGISSALCAMALEPKRAGQYLDACAAPGGKSAYLAERMQNTGRVHAWDIHPHRVELLRATQKRLGLEAMRPMERDATLYREDLEQVFDGVLIDAPCSGLGVMFDKPDIKYRMGAEELHALAEIQAKLLATCANYVAPGGHLVYSTCTVLEEENQRQIETFLSAHPEFQPDEDYAYLPDALKPYAGDGMIQILPNRDQMEGFFIARLIRRGG